MKDYVRSRGPFADWKGEEERRARFLGRAIRILSNSVEAAFSGSVMVKDFNVSQKSHPLTVGKGLGSARFGLSQASRSVNNATGVTG